MALERFSDEERDLIDSEETNSLEVTSSSIDSSVISAKDHGDEEVEGLDMVGDENEAQVTE